LKTSVATLVFNLNPLLRYDGYYILSDLTGIPNLAMRSRELLRYLLERHVFGLRGLNPPHTSDRREFWILVVYAVLSMPYRVLVTLTVIWVLLTTVPWIGIPLAIIGATIVIVLPILGGIGHLLTSPRLMGRRTRALTISAGALAVGAVGLAVVPAPAGVYAVGTMEPAVRVPVRTLEQGRVIATHAQPGQMIRAGEPILTLESPELVAQLARTRAQLSAAAGELDAAMEHDPASAEVTRRRLEYLALELARLQQQERDLVVRASADGRLITSAEIGRTLDNVLGRLLSRGTLLAIIASDDLVVQASVSDRDFAYAFRGQDPADTPAGIRIRGLAGDLIPARVARVDAAASRSLASRSLGADVGGEILLDPTDPDGRRTLESQFIVELSPERVPPGVLPGLRVRIRFDAGDEPLLSQWWRLLRQRITDRMGV